MVFAVQLLSRVMADDTCVPQVVPRYNGGLQLEWHTGGVDLEIVIDPDGRPVSAWCEHVSGREWKTRGRICTWVESVKELSLLVGDAG